MTGQLLSIWFPVVGIFLACAMAIVFTGGDY